MFYIINIITSLFEILTMIIYFESILGKPKSNIPKWLFYLLITIIEISGIYLTFVKSEDTSLSKNKLFMFVNLTAYFLISLFYEVRFFRHRIFATISFYIISALSELIFAMLFFSLNNEFKNKSNIYIDTAITFGGSIITFLIVILISAYTRRKSKKVTLKYTVLLLSTPLLSSFIIITISSLLVNIQVYSISLLCSIFALLFINITNFYLLESILNNYAKDEQIFIMENQVKEQNEKFNQLSDAYRQTRRIIHDVKQHNNYIINCIRKGDYDSIEEVLNINIKEIENKYIFSNTGNLVIDTFVNNYAVTCKEQYVDFQYELTVDCEKIPMPDYDLCIIIGNLLDNSLEANRHISNNNEKYIKLIISTREKFFVIKISNPITIPHMNNDNSDLYHGYGITNIRLITEKYNGLYNCQIRDDYCTTICIPIPPSESGLRLQKNTKPGLDIKKTTLNPGNLHDCLQ